MECDNCGSKTALWYYGKGCSNCRPEEGKENKKENKKKMTPEEIEYKIKSLEGHRGSMINYLGLKVSTMDWHGVADAAMDLREIEIAIQIFRSLQASQST